MGGCVLGVEDKKKADAEGRVFAYDSVVVNFQNIGELYADRVLKQAPTRPGLRVFDWEGVRKCVKYITEDMRMKVIGVAPEELRGPDDGIDEDAELPFDVRELCEEVAEVPKTTARIMPGRTNKSLDYEMTINAAHSRNCRFLANEGMDILQHVHNQKINQWVNQNHELMQLRFYFDSTIGTFDTL